IRKGFDEFANTVTQSASGVYTHTFSASMLNELRGSYTRLTYNQGHDASTYWVPGIIIDDGLATGNFSWSRSLQTVWTSELSDLFTLNRGRHTLKFGVNFRRAVNHNQFNDSGEIPQYEFATMLDFAADKPYLETRAISVATGQAAPAT